MSGEKNKKKMNTYLKTGLIILGAAVLGAIGGFCSFILFDRFEGGILGTIAALMEQIQTLILPLLVLIMVISVVYGEWNHRKSGKLFRKIPDAEDEECDRLEYEADKVCSAGLIVNSCSMGFSVIILALGYSIKYLEHSDRNRSTFLAACIVFLVCWTYDTFWQVRYVKQLQAVYPEKYADPSSRKFRQQWYENCDEAEREVICRSSYKTYMMLNKCVPALLLATLLSHLFLDTGVLAVAVVALIWMVTSVTYTRSCVRLREQKAGLAKP